jgi:anti-sigma B factor antagonist
MLPRALRIEQQQAARPGQRILRLEGPLLMSTMAEFYDVVRADTSPLLIIDCSAVPYVDSAGIGSLIAAYVNRQNSQRKLALVGVNERVHNSLKVAWVEQLFQFFDSVSAAEQISAA